VRRFNLQICKTNDWNVLYGAWEEEGQSTAPTILPCCGGADSAAAAASEIVVKVASIVALFWEEYAVLLVASIMFGENTGLPCT
jgi:hypothetical protein